MLLSAIFAIQCWVVRRKLYLNFSPRQKRTRHSIPAVTRGAVHLFGDPVAAVSTVVPALGLVTLVSYLWWRTMPEPPMAGVVLARRETPLQ